MRATRFVFRSAAGIFAAGVVLTAWRASGPPASYRAVARVGVTGDAAADVPGEIAALTRLGARAHAAVAGDVVTDGVTDGATVVRISVDAGDPLAAAEALGSVVDDYMRTREGERTRRAAALLAETEARVKEQAALVRRLERDVAGAQTLMARVRRDRQVAESHLSNLEGSLARAQEKLAGLEPLVAQIRSGQPAEHLSVVQNMRAVQVQQAYLNGLDAARAGLLARYGPEHPQVERNTAERAAAAARLQAEIENTVAMVIHDYEAARLDKQWLDGERDKAVLLSTQRLPSRAEYESLFRRAEEERTVHAALVRRQRELEGIVRAPGPGVTLIERIPPVKSTPGSPSPWPWALGLLAAVALGLAAHAVIRLRTARMKREDFDGERETSRQPARTEPSTAGNLKKTA